MRSPRASAGLALALVAALAACSRTQSRSGPAAGPPPSVTVTRVLAARLPDEHLRVGQVRAKDDVELRARIEGFLEQRLFEEGSDVQAGDLLFVIEREPYEAKVARAEAELARAEAAQVEAKLDLRRTQELRKQKVATQAGLDAAVAREAGAAAEVLAAAAALREARLDLDYTEIRAPVSGRVGLAAYSVGDLVGPDSGPLATIATIDPIYVYWEAPEGAILDFRRTTVERARHGEEPQRVTARLRFGDGTMYEHEGVWNFLDNRVDPNTGTQTARAVFPNPEGILLPGQYASVIVRVGEPRDTLVIPQASVQEDQAGRFVIVVGDDDLAQVRRVTMGARQGIYWEVVSGLSAGERVIYEGVQKAQPGAAVSPVEHTLEPPVGAAPVPSTEPEPPAPPDESTPSEEPTAPAQPTPPAPADATTPEG